jgi:hypothetical protein
MTFGSGMGGRRRGFTLVAASLGPRGDGLTLAVTA